MRLLILALAFLLADPGLAYARHEQASASGEKTRPPNVIIIFADDLGWGDISLNGADLISTPHIDRIGKGGIRLTTFYSAANVCTPSRAALLTGRYPIRSGMQHVIYPQSTDGLPSSEVTIAEMLKESGYVTHMVGKWHLGHHAPFWPTRHGFDTFFGVAYSNDMQPFDLYSGTQIVEANPDQSTLSRRYSENAAAFIHAHADRPFFLYYAETAPHLPLFVPQEHAGSSKAGLYGDVVEEMDRGIGRLLDALDEAGIADDTLVIFTSDNGPWFEGSAGQLRGHKGGTYEGGYRVPMLARLPGTIPAGSEDAQMAMTIDLLPTIAALTGASLPKEQIIDGVDISGRLRGESSVDRPFLFFANGNDIVAVRDDRFKLLVYDYYRTFYVPFEQFGNLLLFDLLRDPAERFSYAREEPGAVNRLMNALTAFRREIEPLRTDPLDPFAPPGPDTRRGPSPDEP